LDGLEDAPATAIRGEDMKVRAAVCMVGSDVGIAGGTSWTEGGLVFCKGVGFGLGLGLRDLGS
jgi:hypothetical protein